MESLKFLFNPVTCYIYKHDDRNMRLKKHLLFISEHLYSTPFCRSFEHNFNVLYEMNAPHYKTICQIFAWTVLGGITYKARKTGALLILGTLAPKLIHRCTDAPPSRLRNRSIISFIQNPVSATYPGGKEGINIDDWGQVCPTTGVSMLYDGVSHNNTRIVKEEHPRYQNYMNHYTNFASQFDYTQENALETFKEKAKETVNEIHKSHKSLMERSYLERDTAANELMNQLKNDIKNLSQEDFSTLASIIVREKLCYSTGRLHRDRNETKLAVDHIIAGWDALLNKDYSKFQEAVKVLEGESLAEFKQHICHVDQGLTRAGPAFGVAHFFKVEDQHYLYTNHAADISFLIIQPKEGETSIDWQNIDKSQITWVTEDDKCTSGLGSSKEEAFPNPGETHEVRPGTFAMSYTDGIGEFLSKEEVLEVVKQGPSIERFIEANEFSPAASCGVSYNQHPFSSRRSSC